MDGAKNADNQKNETTTVVTENYELIKSDNSEALLILFPGGGGTSKDTKAELDIIEKAADKNISVLFMNFNRHFWIDHETAEQLSQDISVIVKENDLNADKVFIGGMSIGGNVAILLANYLSQSNSNLKPKGVFVVDSPIDLYALYQSAQKDVARKDFSEERLGEPKFIIEYIEGEFGDSSQVLTNIQKVSPITLAANHTDNIKYLKDCKIRLYTEPDSLWWMDNRQTDFESTNAFVIQQTSELLKNNQWSGVELIETKDKGYRSNGERHPHSWSIVGVDELIEWMLRNQH